MGLWKSVCGFILGFFYGSLVFAVSQSPVGRWVTIDEKTGAKRAVVAITESKGLLSGVIDKVYPKPGDTGICELCPGEFKGKKIQGLRFMWGLKSDGENEWSGGSILDPKSGKIYRAKLTLQGDTLLVRGYLGISLLGRTQVWKKE